MQKPREGLLEGGNHIQQRGQRATWLEGHQRGQPGVPAQGMLSPGTGATMVCGGTAAGEGAANGAEWLYWDVDETEAWQEEWRQVRSRQATRRLRKQQPSVEEKGQVPSAPVTPSSTTTAKSSPILASANPPDIASPVPGCGSPKFNVPSKACHGTFRADGLWCRRLPWRALGETWTWASGGTVGWDVVVERTFISVAPNSRNVLKSSASAPGRLQDCSRINAGKKSGRVSLDASEVKVRGELARTCSDIAGLQQHSQVDGAREVRASEEAAADEAAGPPAGNAVDRTSILAAVALRQANSQLKDNPLCAAAPRVRAADAAAGMGAASPPASSPTGKSLRKARSRAAKAAAKVKAAAEQDCSLQRNIDLEAGSALIATRRPAALLKPVVAACLRSSRGAGEEDGAVAGVAAVLRVPRHQAWPVRRRSHIVVSQGGFIAAGGTTSSTGSPDHRPSSRLDLCPRNAPLIHESTHGIFVNRGGVPARNTLAVERCASRSRPGDGHFARHLCVTPGETSFAAMFAMALARERANALCQGSGSMHRKVQGLPSGRAEEASVATTRLKKQRQRTGRSKARKGRCT